MTIEEIDISMSATTIEQEEYFYDLFEHPRLPVCEVTIDKVTDDDIFGMYSE